MTDMEIMNCMEVARIFLDYNDAKNEPLWYDEYDTHECRVGEVKEGASKAVIITDECDYVVKVPFNGTTYYNDECIHCEKCARYAEYEEQMAIRKEEIQKKLIGRGGAVAYFGTNSMIEVEKLAKDGNELAQTFLKAYVLNICKYIAAMAATADGKVDAILLTGGIAHSKELMDAITAKVKFIAPVEVFPGEDEINSLAENGYMILSGQTKIHTYDKDRIIED